MPQPFELRVNNARDYSDFTCRESGASFIRNELLGDFKHNATKSFEVGICMRFRKQDVSTLIAHMLTILDNTTKIEYITHENGWREYVEMHISGTVIGVYYAFWYAVLFARLIYNDGPNPSAETQISHSSDNPNNWIDEDDRDNAVDAYLLREKYDPAALLFLGVGPAGSWDAQRAWEEYQKQHPKE